MFFVLKKKERAIHGKTKLTIKNKMCLLSFPKQSRGHGRRQEVDSGRSEEEAFAAVIRTQTTALASQPSKYFLWALKSQL